MTSSKSSSVNPDARTTQKSRWPFSLEFGMVLAALLFRIALLTLPETVDDGSFNNEITNIAISLSTGHGYSGPFGGQTGPSAWIPPLYPFLCSLIFRMAGGYGKAAIIWVLVMNSLFSAFTCIPVYRTAKRIFGMPIALVTGWMFALFPYFAKWSVTWIWETTLSTLFMSWMFLLMLELREQDTMRNWVKYGLVWGVAMVNNPSIMTLVGVSFLWFLEWGGIKSWKRMATAVLLCGLIISPWLVRNRVVMGKWIFIRSNFGFEFNLGNYPGSLGTCWMGHHPWGSKFELDLYTTLGETEYVAQHGAAAKDFVVHNPGDFVRLCWFRFRAFWSGESMNLRPHWRAFWLPWLYRILTITTGVGLLVMVIRRIEVAQYMFLVIILYPWPYYIACVQTRFRHLIDPMMLMITVYLCFEAGRILWSGIQRYRRYELPQAAEN